MNIKNNHKIKNMNLIRIVIQKYSENEFVDKLKTILSKIDDKTARDFYKHYVVDCANVIVDIETGETMAVMNLDSTWQLSSHFFKLCEDFDTVVEESIENQKEELIDKYNTFSHNLINELLDKITSIGIEKITIDELSYFEKWKHKL